MRKIQDIFFRRKAWAHWGGSLARELSHLRFRGYVANWVPARRPRWCPQKRARWGWELAAPGLPGNRVSAPLRSSLLIYSTVQGRCRAGTLTVPWAWPSRVRSAGGGWLPGKCLWSLLVPPCGGGARPGLPSGKLLLLPRDRRSRSSPPPGRGDPAPAFRGVALASRTPPPEI